jgi:hypothetical protein
MFSKTPKLAKKNDTQPKIGRRGNVACSISLQNPISTTRIKKYTLCPNLNQFKNYPPIQSLYLPIQVTLCHMSNFILLAYLVLFCMPTCPLTTTY